MKKFALIALLGLFVVPVFAADETDKTCDVTITVAEYARVWFLPDGTAQDNIVITLNNGATYGDDLVMFHYEGNTGLKVSATVAWDAGKAPSSLTTVSCKVDGGAFANVTAGGVAEQTFVAGADNRGLVVKIEGVDLADSLGGAEYKGTVTLDIVKN